MHWLESWLLPKKCVLTDELIESSSEDLASLDLSSTIVNQFAEITDVCLLCCEPCFQQGICGSCLVSPPSFDCTQAAYYFSEPLSQLIYDFKYNENIAYGRLLATLMAQKIEINNVQALVAIPSHPKRRQQRGYNQALVLAQALGKIIGLPVIDALERVKETSVQTKLTNKQRKRNLKSAFSVDRAKLHGYTNIALVDDVITTGATMEEAAKTLKKHSDIQMVEAWSVAKTK